MFDIAGLPVLTRAGDADHLAVIDAVFGTIAASSDAPKAEITYSAGRLPKPDRAPDVSQPDLDLWHDGEVLHLSSEVHGVDARVTPTLAEIVGSTAPHERAFRRIFQPVITHLLAYRGIFVLHAASMRRGDRGLLALGETGKGKSTIALAAFQHDWSVMGDDLVALWLIDDVAMIRGLPKPMALPDVEGAPRSTALDGAERIGWDHRGRLHIPVERLDLRPVRLGAILVVDHGGAEQSTLEAIPADRITSALMSSFTSIGDGPLMRSFFPVATRAARVPGGIVQHGSNPATRLEDAQRILSEIAQDW